MAANTFHRLSIVTPYGAAPVDHSVDETPEEVIFVILDVPMLQTYMFPSQSIVIQVGLFHVVHKVEDTHAAVIFVTLLVPLFEVYTFPSESVIIRQGAAQVLQKVLTTPLGVIFVTVPAQQAINKFHDRSIAIPSAEDGVDPIIVDVPDGVILDILFTLSFEVYIFQEESQIIQSG